jgi:diguanylate cyclase (GGDEF)-like protein
LLVAERLRKRIEQIDVPGFGPVTCSFGIATFPNHASSRNGLLEAADRALYDAKSAGRNRVSVFDISSFANNGPSVEMVDALQRL